MDPGTSHENSVPNSIDLLKNFLAQNFTTEPNNPSTLTSAPLAESAQSLPQAFDSGNAADLAIKKPKKRVLKALGKFLTSETTSEAAMKPTSKEEKKGEGPPVAATATQASEENQHEPEAELSFKDIKEEEEEAKSPNSGDAPHDPASKVEFFIFRALCNPQKRRLPQLRIRFVKRGKTASVLPTVGKLSVLPPILVIRFLFHTHKNSS